METFEIFSGRNQGFGEYGFPTEDEMRRCYEKAKSVEQRFMEKFGSIEGPRLGDVVEFADEFRVYKHGQVSENLYGGDKYGMLCICERGSSFTSGDGLSTGGGAFRHIHKSKLHYAGETTNTFWTWGCHGSGARQGIYFTMPVRKWIIPYERPMCRSKVTFNGRGKMFKGRELPAVSITNFDSYMGYAESFVSIKAFLAWADYVGYRYKPWHGCMMEQVSRYRIESRCYTDKDWQAPDGARPMKMIRNGEVKDGWVVNTTDDVILYLWPNIYDPNEMRLDRDHPFYKARQDEKHRLFLKYSGNPMGVEI